MNLKRLRYFVAIGEELNMSRAAKRLGVSQPALSIQINALETELGLDLVIRDQQRIIALTAAGRRYLHDAQHILIEFDAAADAARSIAQGKRGVVRLGLCEEIGSYYSLHLINTCRTQIPDIALHFIELPASELQASLLRGEVDAALVFLPFGGEHIQLQILWKEGWMAAVPHDHPLASRDKLSCRDLAEVGLIIGRTHTDGSLQDPVHAAFLHEGVVPKLSMRALRRSTMLTLAMAGLGVTFLPASLADLSLPALRLIPLISEPMTVALAYPRSSASEEFKDFLQAAQTFTTQLS